MRITPIQTRPLCAPKDDLNNVLKELALPLHPFSVLCITSKVLAIHQGRCVKIDPTNPTQKDDLIKAEASQFLPRHLTPHEHVIHTITDGNLASSAGIDASNGNGYYILWPQKISQAAKEIATTLMKDYKIKNLAVIITDSRSTPLRYGASGYALGAFGITPLYDYVNSPDLFARPLRVEQANIVDGLAAASVTVMGEGNESTPLTIISDIPEKYFSPNAVFEDVKVPFREDMYYPFLQIFEKYN